MSIDESFFKTLFTEVFPKADTMYATAIYKNIIKRNLNENQIAMFLAQCGHESAHFTRFEENLNYSAKALRSVFGKYFQTDTIAEAFARQPVIIANKVYADRMGNGSQDSGDGWKYRGRGPIQITGKENYRWLEYDTGLKCVDSPDTLLSPDNGVIAAFWFFDRNKLFDISDIKVVTRKINGGYNGLEERIKLFDKIKQMLNK